MSRVSQNIKIRAEQQVYLCIIEYNESYMFILYCKLLYVL